MQVRLSLIDDTKVKEGLSARLSKLGSSTAAF